MSTKYDEAAFSPDRIRFEPLKLEDAIELIKQDENAFHTRYDRNLFCPECRIPPIGMVCRDGEYFFRGFPNCAHDPNCSKGFDPISSRILKEFASDPVNHDFLQRKLERFIDRLLQRDNLPVHPLLLRVDNNRCMGDDINPANVRNRQNIRRIPTKSITAPFGNDDLGFYKLFYGNVDVRYTKVEKSEATFFKLMFYKCNSNTVLCSLSCSAQVATYLQNTYRFCPNQLFPNRYVAFYSVLKKNNQYFNARLSHSKLFYIAAR